MSHFNFGCSEPEPSEANLGYVDPAATEANYTPTEVRIKPSVQHEPEGYSRDVRSAFSGLPKVKPQWRDHYMKMLIVGECGQGQHLPYYPGLPWRSKSYHAIHTKSNISQLTFCVTCA